MGNYHPHGDKAIYDALARFAQDYSVRYPLIEGQGNFGNIDGDNPAASRYTEARMTIIAEAVLETYLKSVNRFVDIRGWRCRRERKRLLRERKRSYFPTDKPSRWEDRKPQEKVEKLVKQLVGGIGRAIGRDGQNNWSRNRSWNWLKSVEKFAKIG